MSFALALTLCLLAVGTESEVSEVERLIEVGEFDTASALLDTSEAPAALVARLRGVIAMEKGEFDRAAAHFEQVLSEYQGEPSTSLYLAHVYLELGRAKEAQGLLDALSSLDVVASSLVRARVERALGRNGEAYETLLRALESFPKTVAPLLDLAELCATLKLSSELGRWVRAASVHPALTLDQALALIDVSYDVPRMLPATEALLARFPDSGVLRAHLAYAYSAAQLHVAAARLFEEASRLGANTAFEAADQYRVVGSLEDALRLNSVVTPAKRRVNQRVSILFSSRRMGRVLALEAEAEREGVLSDQNRYRFAYAHYSVGNFQRALDSARELLDTDWREGAQAIIDSVARIR
ncbi:MAG: tetratricopeptide repeat protein [Myxococcota bacterium]